MDRKTKKELLVIVDEQSRNLVKYKSRLHDIVESYKNLVKEKETLENSIKTLTEANTVLSTVCDVSNKETTENEPASEERSEVCIQMLRSSLGALTVEKSRIENELKADRKKLLLQKEELEETLSEKENKWLIEKEKYEQQIQGLKKKVSVQQREREKEQQDHSLMLKELQNILATERDAKDKLEEQLSEMRQRTSSRLSEKRALDYEKCIEDLHNKLKVSENRLQASEEKVKNSALALQKLQVEMDEIKMQYLINIEGERKRADMADEKSKLLSMVNEKRIANLESRISELSSMVGNYDKLRQQDQITIQKLKERVAQLQLECTTISEVPYEKSKLWKCGESDNCEQITQDMRTELNLTENLHSHCQAEILQLREDLDHYKAKVESSIKEKYKASTAFISDAKSVKEIKELRSKITQLHDQLQTAKSQLKLNEEYHNKITTNLEKSIFDMKVLHKQELAQIEISHRSRLLELEHQIQKQRERTLLLLEEKDKEICQLKSSFLTSFVKKEKPQRNAVFDDNVEVSASDQEVAANMLSNSLISSKKDGHILHYIQELARKDVEISNLRHIRIKTESALRKLQQASADMEEKYAHDVETLNSRIHLLESSENKDGTNIEYLKNVVLRFLKCDNPNSRKHMVNAIATVLHFTNSEVQEVKSHLKPL